MSIAKPTLWHVSAIVSFSTLRILSSNFSASQPYSRLLSSSPSAFTMLSSLLYELILIPLNPASLRPMLSRSSTPRINNHSAYVSAFILYTTTSRIRLLTQFDQCKAWKEKGRMKWGNPKCGLNLEKTCFLFCRLQLITVGIAKIWTHRKWKETKSTQVRQPLTANNTRTNSAKLNTSVHRLRKHHRPKFSEAITHAGLGSPATKKQPVSIKPKRLPK